MIVLVCLFLSLALSADAFATAVAFGADGIRVSFRAALTAAIVCGGLFWLALLTGRAVLPLLPPAAGRYASFFTLLLLRLAKIFSSWRQSLPQPRQRQLELRLFGLQMILQIYLTPLAADRDGNRRLSVSEAVWLALALSLDSLACGLAAELSSGLHWFAAGCMLACTLLALLLGSRLGLLLKQVCGRRLQWLGGLILVVLAFTRL